MLFEEVVPNIDSVMGVKAVFGHATSRVMCFGSRSDRATQQNRHYQVARAVAKKALTQRLLITIGGGDMVPQEFAGRILNIVMVSSVYGETEAFIQDPAIRERLAQWPTAVALRDIYEVDG